MGPSRQPNSSARIGAWLGAGLLGVGLFGLSACAPTVAKRGQFADVEAVKQLQAGVSTKADVTRALGSPASVGPFDPDLWYYVGQNTAKTAFFNVDITDRNILAVRFGPTGVLREMSTLDLKDGKEVAIVPRETPTAGNEQTLFQDLFGNIGRFASKAPSQPPR